MPGTGLSMSASSRPFVWSRVTSMWHGTLRQRRVRAASSGGGADGPPDHPTAWAYRVALNHLHRQWRRRGHEQSLLATVQHAIHTSTANRISSCGLRSRRYRAGHGLQLRCATSAT